jgi:squalene synthase HpnC
VASWLSPPKLRPAIVAIYRFARTADDIADEGDAAPAERVAAIDRYERALLDVFGGRSTADWPDVFGPLAMQVHAHGLPLEPLRALLSAFRQDTANPLYDDRAALLDYCARSANPIGRLLLHLAGVDDATARRQSDAVCTALQLINFWQDLSRDLPRGRCYVPRADAQRHGVAFAPTVADDGGPMRALVADLVGWARATMDAGAPLVHRLPGRFGWELRLVVQGGLRILDKLAANGFDALARRPSIGPLDAPLLAWRALAMRRPA